MYDAREQTKATRADCEAMVGRRATLPLTGTIVETRTVESGSFVMFEVDPRWGFHVPFKIGLDLEALEVEERT